MVFELKGMLHMKKKKRNKLGTYEKYIKRSQDFCCSIIALIVLSPIMLIVAILVRMKLGTPIIFKQKRVGLNGKIFTLYKFRTMTDAKNENKELLPDAMRLTKFGRMLRSTSLDELPELVNIIKGDMSLVGPRPLLPRDVQYMNREQNRRHESRPGLTGLAQCSGRNQLNWDEKLAYDTNYIDSITFFLDWKIIWKTVEKVFRHEGIVFEEGNDMDLKDWNELKKHKLDKRGNN